MSTTQTHAAFRGLMLSDRNFTDDLRGFLTLGIVLMHASLVWWGEWIICHNRDALNVFAAVYMHVGIPSFFFLSGYVNTVSYRKWGFRSYWRRRGKRIGLPFLVGSIVLIPMMAYLDARFNNTGAPWPVFLQKINPIHPRFTFYHLWFLYDLLLFALSMPLIDRATLRLASIARDHHRFFFVAYVGANAILYMAARACQATVVPTALIPIASVSLYLPVFIFGALCTSVDAAKLLPVGPNARSPLPWFCAGVCISVTLRLWAPDALVTKVLTHILYVPNAYAGVLCMLCLATSVKLGIAPLAFIWRNPSRVYILHQPLLMALGALVPGRLYPWAGFAVTAIVCLAILRAVSLLLDAESAWRLSFCRLTNGVGAPHGGKT